MSGGWRLAVRVVPSTSAGYGDGPVYVQINKAAAGKAWPRPGYDIKLGDPWTRDTEHDYVAAHNSHSAYVYCRWLCQEDVPASALTVVRLLVRQPHLTILAGGRTGGPG